MCTFMSEMYVYCVLQRWQCLSTYFMFSMTITATDYYLTV